MLVTILNSNNKSNFIHVFIAFKILFLKLPLQSETSDTKSNLQGFLKSLKTTTASLHKHKINEKNHNNLALISLKWTNC